MKKQNKPSTKAHLLRGAFYLLLLSAGTLLAFLRPETPAKSSQRTLTFKERVAYQRAIEEVHWQHRLWPKENPKPKPSLDEVISVEQIEQKVEDYLRDSQALEAYWQKPIAPEQLQAEMERMARDTKQPEVLRELFEALGNNPSVIAECLARPVLTERLVAELSAHDKGQRFAVLRTQVTASKFSITMLGNATYALPEIDPCTDDTWTATTTTNAPSARSFNTAVWTGSEMIVWGGGTASGTLNTGGRFDPSIDSWTATSTTNAPEARAYHTVVWTGSEMIVWGGWSGSSPLNTGGRYNPGTDSWTATSTTNPPAVRFAHTAIWTGSEMIVWGGEDSNGGAVDTGGRYNPGTNSWTAISTTKAPAARFAHTAIWSGSEMIVWGGYNGSYLNTGGGYNPGTDSWTTTSTTNPPDPRYFHTAVWTGSEMIVWGGLGISTFFNTGGRYDPSTDIWTATSTTNAPVGRSLHATVWTGSEMIVWGGTNGPSSFLNTGGRYDSSTDSWTAISTTNAPVGREYHTAVWSGSEMIVWGGRAGIGNDLNTGGRYCAAPTGPTPTPTATATATSTPTPTPTGCSVTSTACGGIVVGTAPTEFTVNLSDPADPATVQASDFTVNGTPANSFSLSNGNTTISFFFFPSPALQGGNVMHIPAGAFNCGNGPVLEFNCGFRYFPSRPRPTPVPRP
jgi:N-acetylneuraminic acid mutarotase